jgi:hypothetical protein
MTDNGPPRPVRGIVQILPCRLHVRVQTSFISLRLSSIEAQLKLFKHYQDVFSIDYG